MKELLKYLPQILNILPGVIQYLKYIPILMILGGIGYGAYYFMTNLKDPYKCVNNEIYEQLSLNSNVYKFKGGYCVDSNTKE